MKLIFSCKWFTANKLSLNIDKSSNILFNTHLNHNWDHQITMCGKCVTRVDTLLFVDVYIDSKLNWHDHISKLSKIIARTILSFLS